MNGCPKTYLNKKVFLAHIERVHLKDEEGVVDSPHDFRGCLNRKGWSIIKGAYEENDGYLLRNPVDVQSLPTFEDSQINFDAGAPSLFVQRARLQEEIYPNVFEGEETVET